MKGVVMASQEAYIRCANKLGEDVDRLRQSHSQTRRSLVTISHGPRAEDKDRHTDREIPCFMRKGHR